MSQTFQYLLMEINYGNNGSSAIAEFNENRRKENI